MIKSNPTPQKEDVNQAIKTLKEGKVILYPTDTIWGLGCDCMCEDGINKIKEIKNRPDNMPFILLVKDIPMLKKYVTDLHPRIESLLVIHKNPLTIIYEKVINLPDFVLHTDGTIGIRIVHDNYCQSLIKGIKSPLVSTSANAHSTPSPKSFSNVQDQIKLTVDYIVKYKQDYNQQKMESTIAKVSKEGELEFLR